VAGVVDSVSGSGVVIKTQDGSTITIALAEGGTVRKQVDGTLAEITPGERIIALGQRNGETFQANVIQVGGGFGRTP
jgi:hypothetical protein